MLGTLYVFDACMNKPLKITSIGNSAGIVLPKEVLARLRVGPGDEVFVSEAPGGIRLSATDPGFAGKMAVAERIMCEDRDILRELAK
jgi:putative addiction module antidote